MISPALPVHETVKWLASPIDGQRQPDSRALYYGDGLGGRGGIWADGTARQGSRVDYGDQIPHLAKVRVAGSNPVFRSILPGQGRFFNP